MHCSNSARDTISCAAGFSVLFDVLTCVLILCPLVADFVLYEYDEQPDEFGTTFSSAALTCGRCTRSAGILSASRTDSSRGEPVAPSVLLPLFAAGSLSVLSARAAPELRQRRVIRGRL